MSTRWNRWTETGRELLALGRQATMLFDENRPDVAVETLAAGDNVVVCLHGLFASAGVLRHIRRAIAPIAPTMAMSYPVGPGIDALTDRLETLINTLPHHVRLHIVGHSVGGLIARQYAARQRAHHLTQTISIASPFAGLHGAKLVGLPIARDLRPDSPILRGLQLGTETSRAVPHVSIVAQRDPVIGRSAAQALSLGRVHTVQASGHNDLLFNREVIDLVHRHIAEACNDDTREGLP